MSWKQQPWTPLNLDDLEVDRYPEERRVRWTIVGMIILTIWAIGATIWAVLA